MAWVRKINRHVQVLHRISASVIKVRPGTITALGAGELVTVRVAHSGQTFANIDRRTDPDENLAATKYIPA
jgi:hypothetical protein